MKAINPIKAATTLAILLGGWHLCWVLLVATGVAQSVIDFVLWMHFIKPVYVVGSFDLAIALLLIAVTASAWVRGRICFQPALEQSAMAQ